MSRYAEAFRDFEKVIQLNPDNADFYVSRGSAYKELGNYDLAIANFEKALELDPNNQTAKDTLEILQQKMQQ